MTADLTAHPDYRQLVRRMREHPEDDLLRGVAADWLEEHGAAEWAEFVRAQIELARMGDRCPVFAGNDRTPPDARCGTCDWCREHYRLSRVAHGAAGVDRNKSADRFRGWIAAIVPGDWDYTEGMYWTAPDLFDTRTAGGGRGLYGLRLGRVGGCAWERGFIGRLELPADLWLAHGDAVYAAHPVTRVRLTEPFRWEARRLPLLGGGWMFGPDDESQRRFFDGNPFRDWRDLLAEELKLIHRTDADGRPIYVSPEAIAAHFLGLRWPGVAFELPPERTGRVVTITREDLFRDTGDELLRQMQRAGLESARRADEAFRRAFFDADGPPE